MNDFKRGYCVFLVGQTLGKTPSPPMLPQMPVSKLLKPEILAPAGCMRRLQTAFAFGADAVYIGGTKFSLRKNADNFNHREMKRAVDYAHARGKKVYVTVNVFPLEHDMAALPAYLRELELVQPDALIISDMGILTMAREVTTIPLHVSTQASVMNQHSIALWQEAGASRVVVGRELSIDECQQLHQQTGVEIETFCHGSMCTSHSGKCVISNYTAGRDSNRGGCVQTCRYVFDVFDQDGEEIAYSAPVMNSKDLMSLHLLPQFVAAGIHSLKIEGRMKSPMYVAMVVAAYRACLDVAYENAVQDQNKALPVEKWQRDIARMSNRHFTSGSLQERAFDDSINYDFPGYEKEIAFAGQVLVADPEKGLIIETRHGVAVGDQCDFIVPACANAERIIESFILDSFYDLSGASVQSLPPNRLMTLPYRDDIPVMSILRLQLEVEEVQEKLVEALT